jgi:hypothetical protein
MNRSLRTLRVAGPLALALVACSGHTDETEGSSSAAVSAAVPKKDWLRLEQLTAAATTASSSATPAQPADSSCQGGPPAMFARMTADIMGHANGVVDGVLGLIGQITQGPPANVAPGHATWGPIPNPQLPVIYRFDVQQVAPIAFHFQLSGRPAAGDESTWRGLFQGDRTMPDDAHRVGDLLVDFGAIHSLDPSSQPTGGGVGIHFLNAPDGRGIDESFSGITGDQAPNPNDAHYAYHERADGRTFDFVTRTDFDHDGRADELLHVQSRWAPPGAGKASVVVTGGDLGPKQVAAIECWDPQLATVFYADDINANPPLGDVGCCIP